LTSISCAVLVFSWSLLTAASIRIALVVAWPCFAGRGRRHSIICSNYSQTAMRLGDLALFHMRVTETISFFNDT